MIKKCWIDIQRRMKKTCEASQRSEKWRSIIYSTGYIGSKYLNITYSVKKCVIKIYIATPEIINFLCYYVYSYLFQWNDNVNINYPAEYEIGYIVFTCIGAALFGQISAASNCWSNHVGIIIGHNGEDFLVAESRVPLSTITTLSRFIKRSSNQRYAIKRLGDAANLLI